MCLCRNGRRRCQKRRRGDVVSCDGFHIGFTKPLREKPSLGRVWYSISNEENGTPTFICLHTYWEHRVSVISKEL